MKKFLTVISVAIMVFGIAWIVPADSNDEDPYGYEDREMADPVSIYGEELLISESPVNISCEEAANIIGGDVKASDLQCVVLREITAFSPTTDISISISYIPDDGSVTLYALRYENGVWDLAGGEIGPSITVTAALEIPTTFAIFMCQTAESGTEPGSEAVYVTDSDDYSSGSELKSPKTGEFPIIPFISGIVISAGFAAVILAQKKR